MKGMKIIEGALDTLQFFFLFLLSVRQIRMFFSLKHSASQGESFLKFQLAGFVVLEEQTSKQTDRLTHSLTDWRFYRVSISMAKDQYFENLSRKAFLARKCSNEETNVSNLLQTLIFIIVIFYDAMMIVTLNITCKEFFFSLQYHMCFQDTLSRFLTFFAFLGAYLGFKMSI